MSNKLVVIVGPTASGKSELGVQLAQKFQGEIVSADSRQVYKGLDIGSAKISKTEMRGIPHHLLDIASPRRKFTVAQYQKLALEAIRNIQKRSKLPFLVGGSPFYIYAVVDSAIFPEIKPDPLLRSQLSKLDVSQLYQKLQKLDPKRARTIDQNNPRRLSRALEIVISTGKPVPQIHKGTTVFDTLLLGLNPAMETLKARVAARLAQRLKKGMLREISTLRKQGISWKRLEDLGLEYRYGALYMQKKISRDEMIRAIQRDSEDFIRRQMTWFKKDSRIHWIEDARAAANLVASFIEED